MLQTTKYSYKKNEWKMKLKLKLLIFSGPNEMVAIEITIPYLEIITCQTTFCHNYRKGK